MQANFSKLFPSSVCIPFWHSTQRWIIATSGSRIHATMHRWFPMVSVGMQIHHNHLNSTPQFSGAWTWTSDIRLRFSKKASRLVNRNPNQECKILTCKLFSVSWLMSRGSCLGEAKCRFPWPFCCWWPLWCWDCRPGGAVLITEDCSSWKWWLFCAMTVGASNLP